MLAVTQVFQCVNDVNGTSVGVLQPSFATTFGAISVDCCWFGRNSISGYKETKWDSAENLSKKDISATCLYSKNWRWKV